MSIIGIEQITLGVEDVAAAARFCRDFGLLEDIGEGHASRFYCLDGSRLVLRPIDDSTLPPPNAPGSTVREIIWRVRDHADLAVLESAIGRERTTRASDGVLRCSDDVGYWHGFAVPRKPGEAPLPARPAINSRASALNVATPRAISHIVVHVPELPRCMEFYTSRLGFRPTDFFNDGKGVFLRSSGSNDHHKLFLLAIDRPLGLNHVAFEVADFGEVIAGGKRLVSRKWASAWGPGRHILGSNFFWYFESPIGGAMEYTCGFDQMDDDWKPGWFDLSAENAALYTLRYEPNANADVENVAHGVE